MCSNAQRVAANGAISTFRKHTRPALTPLGCPMGMNPDFDDQKWGNLTSFLPPETVKTRWRYGKFPNPPENQQGFGLRIIAHEFMRRLPIHGR